MQNEYTEPAGKNFQPSGTFRTEILKIAGFGWAVPEKKNVFFEVFSSD